MTEIADDLTRCVSTISDWLVMAHEDAIRSRYDKEASRQGMQALR